MGFWTPDRLTEFVPPCGHAFVRTRLGLLCVWHSHGYCGSDVYSVGHVANLDPPTAAAVLDLIGAYPPRRRAAGAAPEETRA